MDTKTLAFAAAMVGTALALSTVVFAAYRRERGFSIYAAGFISAVASFLVLANQGALPRVVGFLLTNMLLLFFQLSLPWGLRSHSGIKPAWPPRFWSYLLAWLAVVIVATTVFDSFTVRATLSSVFIILGSAEFFLALVRIKESLSKVVRRTASAVVVAFIILHMLRIVLVLSASNSRAGIMDNDWVNIYTFSFTLFFAILWAGLVLVIDAAGILAQLEQKNRILQELATSDELTGLSNRHSLDAILASEMERSSRYREPLSIIMFDIDFFKRINDTRGHQTGDEVLKRISEITRKLIREPDNLFRWGGEEFLLLAPHTGLDGAITLAEKLRTAIEAEAFAGAGSVTASFGVADWMHLGSREMPAESREGWFKRVDQALYRAKNTGRNRVVGFGTNDAMPLALVNIEWRTDWESGNRLIDDEHRKLLDLSNNLLDVSMSGCTKQEMLVAVDALIGHVAAHFADEETILEAAAYPELKAHAELHKGLVQAALDLRSSVETGTADSATLFDFLVDQVVVGHLINEDTKFFGFTKRLPDATGVR